MTTSNPSRQTVGILGGGISGLTAAYSLINKGIKPVVYEKSSQPGGVIRSERIDRWLLERGPNTLLIKSRKVQDLLEELDLYRVLLSPSGSVKNRFIVKDKSLKPIPTTLGQFVSTDLISTSAKLGLFKEPFISKSESDDESVADFFKRRLGNELLDYGIDPFVAGVYAGIPEKLSVKHTFKNIHELEQKFGSLLKGKIKQNKNSGERPVKRRLASFEEGLQTLPNTLAEHIKKSGLLRLNHTVTAVHKTDKGYEVQCRSNGETRADTHPVLISTIPPHSYGGIDFSLERREAFEILGNVPYAPLAVLHLGFNKEQVDHELNGFGFLVPGKEPFDVLGTVFSSSLFPGRAPDGRVLLTCFIGGTRRPEMADRPIDQLVSTAIPELSLLLGIEGAPEFMERSYWNNAIPQYELGYEKYLEAIKQIENDNPGFLMTGNYREGVSVPECIINGIETADNAAVFLSPEQQSEK